MKPIFHLDVVFRNQRVWCMAIIAGGIGVMARFLPAVKLIAHDMAICADRWIIVEVGISLGVVESIEPQSKEYPQQDRQFKRREFDCLSYLHSRCLSTMSGFLIPIAKK